ncbi:MAG: hypothetical protein U5M50_04040 [Sphingobium sp.]|nr:hypothetical protein [Sphingobium sp.]
MNAPSPLFDNARRVDAADVAKRHGAKLFDRSDGKRGACILCKSGETSGSEPFRVKDRHFTCFACGEHGDAIQLEMLAGGHGTPREAAEALVGQRGSETVSGPVREKRARRGLPDTPFVDSIVVAQHIWSTARGARGTIVERWLAVRGLDVADLLDRGVLDRLRFHPACPALSWRSDEGPQSITLRAPAMIALIEAVEGPRGARATRPMGVHVTYLRGDGTAKARFPQTRDGRDRPSRKMFGQAQGGAVMLSAIDAPAPRADALACACPLVVGEGIETTLSMMQDQPGQCRGAATLSLNNLQGFAMLGANGELPLWNLRPDMARPPFLFADPGAVVVAVDGDMKPLTKRVQGRRGARWEQAELTAQDRAEMCAVLAVKAWRSAGGGPVSACRPPLGMDFNDVRMARA